MLAGTFNCLPMVTDSKEICGILTSSDLVKALARMLSRQQTSVTRYSPKPHWLPLLSENMFAKDPNKPDD